MFYVEQGPHVSVRNPWLILCESHPIRIGHIILGADSDSQCPPLALKVIGVNEMQRQEISRTGNYELLSIQRMRLF